MLSRPKRNTSVCVRAGSRPTEPYASQRQLVTLARGEQCAALQICRDETCDERNIQISGFFNVIENDERVCVLIKILVASLRRRITRCLGICQLQVFS